MYQSRILIHLLWSCENDNHSLKSAEDKVKKYLLSIAHKHHIKIVSMVVLSNHVHCIVEFNSVQSVSDVVQILKGSCSLWINSHLGLPFKFKWEDGYYAFSLGYSQLSEFEKYLLNQKELHQGISLKQELAQIRQKYQLS